MQQSLQQKKGLVQNVFNKVYDKYDLMNDLMSLGVHRSWKNNLIKMMNPSVNQNLIDVGCGTGDIAKLYLETTNKKAEVLCLDPNIKMLEKGKKRLSGYKNIKWEEYDLYLRYLKKESKIVNIKKNTYFYRKHKNNMSSNLKWINKAWNELIKKYGIKKLIKYGYQD